MSGWTVLVITGLVGGLLGVTVFWLLHIVEYLLKRVWSKVTAEELRIDKRNAEGRQREHLRQPRRGR